MCVIVHVPAGFEVPGEDILAACWRSNPDGGGIMFHNKEENIIDINKSLELDQFLYLSERVQEDTRGEVDITMHFRIGTCGEDGMYNVHPFYADPSNTKQAAFCHNGQLFGMKFNAKMCDSHFFASHIMAKCPPKWWKNRAMLHLLEEYIESKYDKAAIQYIRGDKQYSKVMGSGSREGGIWYSNLGWKHRVVGRHYSRKETEQPLLPGPAETTDNEPTKTTTPNGEHINVAECCECGFFSAVVRVYILRQAFDEVMATDIVDFACRQCLYDLKQEAERDHGTCAYYRDPLTKRWEDISSLNHTVILRLFS